MSPAKSAEELWSRLSGVGRDRAHAHGIGCLALSRGRCLSAVKRRLAPVACRLSSTTFGGQPRLSACQPVTEPRQLSEPMRPWTEPSDPRLPTRRRASQGSDRPDKGSNSTPSCLFDEAQEFKNAPALPKPHFARPPLLSPLFPFSLRLLRSHNRPSGNLEPDLAPDLLQTLADIGFKRPQSPCNACRLLASPSATERPTLGREVQRGGTLGTGSTGKAL